MKFINLEKAKKLYYYLSVKRECEQKENIKFLDKFKFLILSNLYDRDFGSSEYS